MTDIWDEKPEHWGEGVLGAECYPKRSMDAWLEKLKEEVVTAWTKDENRLTKVIVERGRKLKAIKKLTNAWNVTGYDSTFALHALKEIISILEGVD